MQIGGETNGGSTMTWSGWRTARWVYLGVLVLVSLVYLLVAPGLLPWVAAGLGVGLLLLALRRLPRRVLAVGVVVTVVTLAVVQAFLLQSPRMTSPCPGASFSARLYEDYRYADGSGPATGWTVRQTMTLRRAALEFSRCGGAKVPDASTVNGFREVVDQFDPSLTSDGWTRTVQTADQAVFDRSRPASASVVSGSWLHHIVRIESPGVWSEQFGSARPDETSKVVVRVPKGAVASVDPPGSTTPVPGGDRFDLPALDQGEDGALTVDLLTPTARLRPLRALTQLPTGNLAGFVLLVLWLVGIAFAKDLFKAGVKHIWGTRKNRNSRQRTTLASGAVHHRIKQVPPPVRTPTALLDVDDDLPTSNVD
jgi:hypothetical protein